MEGVDDAEAILSSLLIVDNKNATYTLDFNKFLATITGGHIGPGVGSTGGGSGSTSAAAAAYY